MERLIVTLDGPAGSGKSSTAKRLARRLGVAFLDTGAMYRALAALCIDLGVDVERDSQRVIEVAEGSRFYFDWGEDPPRVHVVYGGRDYDVTGRLRDADVTHGASVVAVLGPVRRVMVRQQQEIGREIGRLVSEGRDQGTVVFPDAQVKFYLDARPEIRARRRALELRAAGKEADERQILQEILQRDRRDSTRAEGPLVCPPDAIRIDTSDLSLEEVVDLLERLVRERVGCEVGREAGEAAGKEEDQGGADGAGRD